RHCAPVSFSIRDPAKSRHIDGGSRQALPDGSERVVLVSMARIVMKFGGTSVANPERIYNVARHVKREVDAGHEVAVVVSAMSGKTNELVGWVQEMPKV